MRYSPEKPFVPPKLPPPVDLSNSAFADELLRARVELAELKGYGQLLPNPLLLLSPAVLRESIASSEIENIHTTILDALQMQLFPESQQTENDKEVLRYRDALLEGFKMLEHFPVCTRMIHRVHKRLTISPERGYRRQQNRIVNNSTHETIFTPPPAKEISALMSDWEKFLNRSNDQIDPLIKAAIAHYQFEAIHPFHDGNGRCGRILIVLYLVNAGILRWPILFISAYLIRHRADYYRLLLGVTRDRRWDEFIRFILTGFHEQAGETRQLLLDTMELLERYKNSVRKKLPKIYSYELIEALFSYPVTSPAHLARALNVHQRTASRYLSQLEDKELVKDRTHGRYHLFFNTELLELLQRQQITPAAGQRGANLETIPENATAAGQT